MKQIKICGPIQIKVVEEMLNSIKAHKYERALDVAGGSGRFSVDYFLKHYEKVDLFDTCPRGLKQARKAMGGHKGCGNIFKASMQD